MGLPVVTPAREHAGVEHHLVGEVRLAHDEVGGGFDQPTERRERLLARVEVPAVARDEDQHVGVPELGRHPVQGGCRACDRVHRELVGGRGDDVAVEVEDLARLALRVEQRTGEDFGAEPVKPDVEPGHDPEVAAAAARRPEQVGILVGGRAHPPAVGEQHVHREHVVRRQAPAAAQPPEPATQRQARDAGPAHDPRRSREPVHLGRRIEVAPHGARLDRDRLRGRIHHEAAHRGQVDDDAVVAQRGARDVVPAAPDRHGQAAIGREGQGQGGVTLVRAAGDQRRTAIDGVVPEPPGVVVARAIPVDEHAFEARERIGGRHRAEHGRDRRAWQQRSSPAVAIALYEVPAGQRWVPSPEHNAGTMTGHVHAVR